MGDTWGPSCGLLAWPAWGCPRLAQQQGQSFGRHVKQRHMILLRFSERSSLSDFIGHKRDLRTQFTSQ